VTLPHTDEQWSDIMRLGKRVDNQLKKLDVRLTMGGEPTCVGMSA
jgi:uncharacterized protein (DUF2126 family)